MDRIGLAKKIRDRRLELGISVSAAARTAGVNRITWTNWEKLSQPSLPEEFNFVRIEGVLQWHPGGVRLALAGQDPIRIEDIPHAATPVVQDLNEEVLDDLRALREELLRAGARAEGPVMRFLESREPDRDKRMRTWDAFITEVRQQQEDAERDEAIQLRKRASPFE